MGTKISYVDETWNPVVGCTKCSPGCENCYAEKMAYRLVYMGVKKYEKVIHCILYGRPRATWVKDNGGWTGEVYCDEKALGIPLHWHKPRRILVPSMGDLFHPKVPFGFIEKVIAIIEQCPQHTFQMLTKRPHIMAEYFNGLGKRFELSCCPHIHLGVTICNQKEADEILPIALQIPGFDWVSFEPLLSGIDFSDYMGEYLGSETCSYGNMHKKRECECTFLGNLKFAVVGGESGPKRRPCKLEHIRSIVQQCKAAGVGCYVKQVPMPWCGKEYRGQWAEMPTIEELDEMNKMKNYVSHDPAEWPEDLRVRETIC